MDCYHVSDDKKGKKKTVFLVSLHFLPSLHFEPGLQSAFCTDRFPNTRIPKMAKNHEISEYFFDKYDLSLIYVPHRHNGALVSKRRTLLSWKLQTDIK